MKTDPVPARRQPNDPLWKFRCAKLGFDVALIPHSKRDRIRLRLKAKLMGLELADYIPGEIPVALAPGGISASQAK